MDLQIDFNVGINLHTRMDSLAYNCKITAWFKKLIDLNASSVSQLFSVSSG